MSLSLCKLSASFQRRASAVLLLLFLYFMWTGACAAQIHQMPYTGKTDISKYYSVTKEEELTKEDYDIIFRQTGITKLGMNTLLKKNRCAMLEPIQQRFYEKPETKTIRANLVCHQEWLDKETEAEAKFVVEDGDVIITLASYLGGWRYGHCGLVLDAEKGTVLEAITYGEPSCIEYISHWSEYPAYVILRPIHLTENEKQQAISYALSDLQGIPYDLLSFKSKSSYGKITRTHCSHLVWYAYHYLGIDLDKDGTPIVTPYDILHSDELEPVQVWGMCLNGK